MWLIPACFHWVKTEGFSATIYAMEADLDLFGIKAVGILVLSSYCGAHSRVHFLSPCPSLSSAMFTLELPACNLWNLTPWKSIFLPLISICSTGILCPSLTQTIRDHISKPQQKVFLCAVWWNKQDKKVCVCIQVYVCVKRETQTFLFACGLYRNLSLATNISKYL